MKYSLLIIIAVLTTLLSCKKPVTETPPVAQPSAVTALSYTLDAQGYPSGMYNL